MQLLIVPFHSFKCSGINCQLSDHPIYGTILFIVFSTSLSDIILPHLPGILYLHFFPLAVFPCFQVFCVSKLPLFFNIQSHVLPFIQTGWRGGDGQPGQRELAARQWLHEWVVPHLHVDKPGVRTGGRERPCNPLF